MKLVANKASYGFLKKLWAKGDKVEIEKGIEYPKDHFDVVDEKPEVEKPKDEKPKAKPKAEAQAK